MAPPNDNKAWEELISFFTEQDPTQKRTNGAMVHPRQPSYDSNEGKADGNWSLIQLASQQQKKTHANLSPTRDQNINEYSTDSPLTQSQTHAVSTQTQPSTTTDNSDVELAYLALCEAADVSQKSDSQISLIDFLMAMQHDDVKPGMHSNAYKQQSLQQLNILSAEGLTVARQNDAMSPKASFNIADPQQCFVNQPFVGQTYPNQGKPVAVQRAEQLRPSKVLYTTNTAERSPFCSMATSANQSGREDGLLVPARTPQDLHSLAPSHPASSQQQNEPLFAQTPLSARDGVLLCSEGAYNNGRLDFQMFPIRTSEIDRDTPAAKEATAAAHLFAEFKHFDAEVRSPPVAMQHEQQGTLRKIESSEVSRQPSNLQRDQENHNQMAASGDMMQMMRMPSPQQHASDGTGVRQDVIAKVRVALLEAAIMKRKKQGITWPRSSLQEGDNRHFKRRATTPAAEALQRPTLMLLLPRILVTSMKQTQKEDD